MLSCPLNLKTHDHLSQPPGKYGYKQLYDLSLATLDNLVCRHLTVFLSVCLATNGPELSPQYFKVSQLMADLFQ